MNEPKEVPSELIKKDFAEVEVRAVAAELIKAKPLPLDGLPESTLRLLQPKKEPMVVIIDTGVSHESVYAELIKKGIPTDAVKLVARKDASEEQLKRANFISAADIINRKRQKDAALAAAFKPHATVIDQVKSNLPTKRQMMHARTLAMRQEKIKEHRAKHNKPDVAAKYREERIAKKKALAESRSTKSEEKAKRKRDNI